MVSHFFALIRGLAPPPPHKNQSRPRLFLATTTHHFVYLQVCEPVTVQASNELLIYRDKN